MANEPGNTILSASELEVRYNEQIVLDHASLSISEGDRIGMVGRNGSGKSTFLKILAGRQEPDGGAVTRRRDLVTSYLSQEFTLDSKVNVFENIKEGARHVLDLIHEFETLPADSKRHDILEERIMALDGWNLDHRIKTAMSHLGVPDSDRQIDTLSGGEKRRVALCRAIVALPDLLLLDEPTNHLDPESIEWVAEFLESYPGTVLLVTHDRYFLDRVTNCIVELSGGQFYSYTGNYTDYLLARAERQATEELVEHKRQMFLRRELEWVRRGPKARTTKSKSRLDNYFEIAGQKAPDIESDMELVIPPPPQLGNRVVDLSGVGLELGGKRLFSNLNITFANGTRVGVCGRNGLGKTSLVKVILGQLAPTEGTVKVGQLTKFNYVDQSRLQLREDRTVLDEVGDGTEFVIFGEHKLSLRAYLKRFLFADDRITTQVKYLSGGERSRLLLARILKNGGNFLILDEPTNDLDLPTLRILEEALIGFPGCVLVVSHDRYFLNRVCTDILAFEGDGQVAHSVGDYDYYLDKRNKRASSQAAQAASTSIKSTGSPEAKKVAAGKPRKLSFKEQQELDNIEAKILAAEQEASRIEALFSEADFHRRYGQQIDQFNKELASAKAKSAKLFERWQELEAIANSGG